MGILMLSGAKELVEFFEFVDEGSRGDGAFVCRVSTDMNIQ